VIRSAAEVDVSASALLVTCTCALLFGVPPTREEIVAYANDCREKKIDIDLIAKFGKDFRGLDLRGVDLSGGYWKAKALQARTNWQDADLTEAILEDAVLNRVDLGGANLSRTRLRGASLTGATLSDARLDGADLRDASLIFANAANARFVGADLTRADIGEAYFTGADLTGAVLRGARCGYYTSHFRSALLVDVDFEGAKLLPGADFTDADLTGAKLRDGAFPRAYFSRANLATADFTDADLEYALFDDVRGISDEQRSRLQARSGRWKYETRLWAEFLLACVSMIAYFALPPVVGLWIGIRELRRATTPAPRWFGSAATALNLLILMCPAIVLLFGFIGSPVAQLNGPNPLGIDGWRLWMRLWPALVNGLTGCILVAASMSLFALVQIWFEPRIWRMLFVCGIVTTLHAVLQYLFVIGLAPRA
jgi:uncharacterized protein YjbI with pentapeptide repeats